MSVLAPRAQENTHRTDPDDVPDGEQAQDRELDVVREAVHFVCATRGGQADGGGGRETGLVCGSVYLGRYQQLGAGRVER